ncbi:MAG: efflux transporter outer membrane subunit [Luteimonas sp.]
MIAAKFVSMRQRCIGLLLTAIACAMAGCVSTSLPDLSVPLTPQWRNVDTSSGNGLADMAATRWWSVFADPALDALIQQALSANLDIAEAGMRLRAARTLNAHAGGPLRPSLAFATSNPVDPDASASFLLAGFDAIWEFDLFGRGTALHRVARGDLARAQADVSEAHLTVVAEVARNWIELRSAQAQEAELARIGELRYRQSALIDEELRLRLVAPQVALRARAVAASADAAISEPHAAAVAAAQALAALLGRAEPDRSWLHSPSQSRTVDLSSLPLPAPPADLLRTRPDIARSEAAVVHAAGELGLANADRYPRVAIGGSIVFSTSEIEDRPTTPSSISSFGPIIDIPLFDWGLRRAKADARGALLQAAAIHYRKTVLDAVAEVETALSTTASQRRRVQSDSSELQALDAVSARTAERHRLGLASGLDVVGDRIEREQAAVALAESQLKLALDYIALQKALGNADVPSSPAVARVR